MNTKTALFIFVGLIAVAVSVYLGLTYDKRTWMSACMDKPNNTESLCEDLYRVYPK